MVFVMWSVVCVVVCGVVWCGVVWHAEKPREKIQNASVCTSSKACARVAGIHGDVLNVHTDAF